MTAPAVADPVAQIVLGCEKDPALAYVSHQSADPERASPSQLELTLGTGDVLVVSDLHLAAGLRSDGTYSCTENFFALGAFQRFVRNRVETCARSPGSALVVNGDLVDFVRIMDIPDTSGELTAWSKILARLGIARSPEELSRSMSKKERRHGLKSTDYKAVWKLHAAATGHATLFDAIAEWIRAGHRLIVVKGNHDLEWFWPAVRNYLRLVIADRLAAALGANSSAIADHLRRIRFVDDAVVIDGQVYLEHGHRYDRFAWPIGNPTVGDGTELNYPFGSFFNRYLINHVELDYPYVDNVRPAQNIVPLMIRERFPTALKLLFQHVPFTFRVIPKRYFRYLFGQALVMGLALAVPAVATVALLGKEIAGLWAQLGEFSASLPAIARFLWNEGLRLSGSLGGLVMSYVFARLVAMLQLKSPQDLTDAGRRRLDARIRLVVFGHTRNPAQAQVGAGGWVFNTGTWIPVIELSTAEVRHDRTFTFLHLKRGQGGKLAPGVIERWVDEAGRAEPMVILERSDSRSRGGG